MEIKLAEEHGRCVKEPLKVIAANNLLLWSGENDEDCKINISWPSGLFTTRPSTYLIVTRGESDKIDMNDEEVVTVVSFGPDNEIIQVMKHPLEPIDEEEEEE